MKKLNRRLIVIGAFQSISIGVFSKRSIAQEDLYELFINSVSKQPFVSFFARSSPANASGLPGHSYVGVGVELDNGLLFYERIFGYYPKSETVLEEVKSVFSSVTGDIKSKLEDISWDIEFRVNTSDEAHSAAIKVLNKWTASDPGYNLLASGGKNCSSLAAEVATAIGLKVPNSPGSKFPIKFMQELRELNQ